MRHVFQKHANGCGVATLAMLTGESYDSLLAEIDSQEGHGHNGDWDANGITHITLDRLLIDRGFFLARVYKDASKAWPPQPWAPQHFASVKQSSGNAHFVAMDCAGVVLDPLRSGEFRLSDWPAVNNVVGLVKP